MRMLKNLRVKLRIIKKLINRENHGKICIMSYHDFFIHFVKSSKKNTRQFLVVRKGLWYNTVKCNNL